MFSGKIFTSKRSKNATDTFFEVSAAAFFTFFPIFTLSFDWIKYGEDIDYSFWDNFFSFFSKGEVFLLLIGVCSSCLYLVVFNKLIFSKYFMLFSMLVYFALILTAATIISDTGRFKFTIPDKLRDLGFIMYGIFLLFWSFIIFWVKAGSDIEMRIDSHAEILEAAKKLRNSEEAGS